MNVFALIDNNVTVSKKNLFCGKWRFDINEEKRWKVESFQLINIKKKKSLEQEWNLLKFLSLFQGVRTQLIISGYLETLSVIQIIERVI
jgi:hypothetical protein